MNNSQDSKVKVTLTSITEEEPINGLKDAEYAITERPLILTIVLCLIGLILFTYGKMEDEEIFDYIGIILFVSTIIWYLIIAPLFKVIAGISKNLRELNSKTKQQ